MVFANAPQLPTLRTEVSAPNLSLHAGGGAFITGATLVALGYPVRQFSNLHATPFDTIVLADMAAHDVDATVCKPADNGIDPQITVAVATADEHAFLTRAAGHAIPDFSAINSADFVHLHIGKLRTLQDALALLDHARAAGLAVSLDCGWQDSYDPDVTALIAAMDVFLPNESEIAALTCLAYHRPARASPL